MQNNTQQIAGAIVIAGVIIAGAILLKDGSPREPMDQVNTNPDVLNFEDINIRAISASDHILGNKNAKVVVVEYSDTECPFCKRFHETMHQIIDEKGVEVAWVYRHYPIPQLHPKAAKEAEATECAWEQGGNTAFWKYIDRMFEITPSNNNLEDSQLSDIAEYLNLNTSAFYTCLESGKYKAKVDSDVADGVKAGVNGTPYSFILFKGKVVDHIPGAQPYESVIQRLEELTN